MKTTPLLALRKEMKLCCSCLDALFGHQSNATQPDNIGFVTGCEFCSCLDALFGHQSNATQPDNIGFVTGCEF